MEDELKDNKTKPLAPARWYVVHTYSGHEQKVKINLEKRLKFFNLEGVVEEIFIPTQQKIEVKEGKRREVTERLFPGYILVKTSLNDEIFSVVKGTPGVTAFVGTADKAVPLSEKEVEAIKNFSEQDAPQFETQFTLGEGIKITDGPFTDFVGTVDEIDQERGKIKVLVSIFGRETPVELDFLQVGKL
ncbi:transcription termination/antitermination factor NusG [candidate division WWE3 bacterium]|uniref:Transcription termination/antitermination protein NusG n=1 Tax=candidate division WWE3 bacterium TaxID=2053526 RepID=A0A955LKJ0_UNCKA|nr:transcription termination/antitermination factor NusG [candidate division WWE3 bacterium]